MIKKIVSTVSMLILLVGCIQNTSTNYIKKDATMTGIHEISYEELQKKFKENTAFVLYIGRPDCPDCAEFYPIIESYLRDNEGMYVYYLNVKAFRDASREEDASEEEIAFYNNIQEELSFDWTPTLHLFKGREVLSTYTYLDRDFQTIKEAEEQRQRKEEFIREFKSWIDEKYE